MPLNSGQVLNQRYRIARLIAQGGFGAVYRAWDLNLNQACALKENTETGPEAQRQFLHEAQILHNLRHANLPLVKDYFLIPDQGQYLVMDFVEGKDLDEILAEQGSPLPLSQVLDWLSQICDALTYLHSQNPPVIHRDLKPANIKITPDGRAMLVDFGIAKIYSASGRTTVGARAVTPGYSPLEQYGQGSTDARSDIYALGATAYTLLTGETPPSSVDIMAGTAPPLLAISQLNPSVPEHVSQAVLRAMSLRREDRYRSSMEFKSALSLPATAVLSAPVAVGMTGSLASAGHTVLSGTQVLPGSPMPAESPPAPVPYPASWPAPAEKPRPTPWAWIAGAGAGALVLALILFLGGRLLLSGSTREATRTLEAAILPTFTTQPTYTPLPTYTQPPVLPAVPTQLPAPSTPIPPSPLPPNPVPPTIPPPPTQPPRKESARVLWDVSHGPRQGSSGEYSPRGVYGALAGQLTGLNISLESGSLQQADGYNALVIASVSAVSQAYTPDEANWIAQYVGRGKGLLILGENPGFANHVQAVADLFGVTMGQQPELSAADQVQSSHPIFAGVQSLDFYQGGSLELSGTANPLAWGSGAVACAENVSLGGRVILLADGNMFDSRWLGKNQSFAANLFRWLTRLGE